MHLQTRLRRRLWRLVTGPQVSSIRHRPQSRLASAKPVSLPPCFAPAERAGTILPGGTLRARITPTSGHLRRLSRIRGVNPEPWARPPCPKQERLARRVTQGEKQSMNLKRSTNSRTSRLICLACSAFGLLIISIVLRGVDRGPGPSALFDVFAEPAQCRLAVGAALQAEVTCASDAETPPARLEQTA